MGLHSYKQLATELTATGIATRCEASVESRYALIRIPAQPWKSLQPLLEAALDVKFEVTADGLVLTELAPGVTEDEILGKTEASYQTSPDLKPMAV